MPLLTYDQFAAGSQVGGSIREDLMDFIENVSPRDTPLYNNLGAVGVRAGYVEYLEDTFRDAAANAFTEGAAATDKTLTVPSRSASIVQNFQEHFHVSGRQDAVNHAGMANQTSYQEMKALVQIKRDLELALHRGSVVTGNTGTAPQFKGILNFASTYNTSSSGTTLTEPVFNDLLTLNYATPVDLSECYVNMLLKRTINNYSTNVVKHIPADAKRQVNLVDIYESEVGVLAVFKSRDQLQAASKTAQGNSFAVIDPRYWQVGWLRPFAVKELGLDGDRTRKMIVGECTLIGKSEKAAVVGTSYVSYLP